MFKHAARRTDLRLTLIGVVAFALAGMTIALAMPATAAQGHGTDMWFVAHDGTATTWVLVGLLFALTGTTVVRSLRVDRRRGRRTQKAPLPVRVPQELEQLMAGDPIETPPSTPVPNVRAADMLELVTRVECRDRDLLLMADTTVRLVHLRSDPCALHLYISEPDYPPFWAETHWLGSRDAFISAGCDGVSLPGFDMVMARVAVEDCSTPVLRVSLYETDPMIGELGGHTGYVLHMDLALNHELRKYLEQLKQVMPPGSEYDHLDLDGMISQLLGAQTS